MPSSYPEVFRSRRLAVIFALGFSSGLPLALSGGTLQAWMTVEGVDLSTIGVFTLVGLPYVWKFLWAPAMDRFVPPFLGRRRGWLLVTQLALIAGIAGMALLSPRTDLALLAAFAVFVAFASASQDIVVDAYRTDVTSRKQRGIAGALGVVGYRLAMLASGALALVLVAGSGWMPALGWRNTYLLMAVLMAVGVVAAFCGEEPATAPAAPRTLRAAVFEPLREFFSRPGAAGILVLLVLYKLGDAFAGSLTTAFLLRGAGFSLEDVGYVNKAVGLVSTIVGVLFGGALMVRLGLYRALLGFGMLQAVGILTFMWLALVGKSYPVMVLAVAMENLTGGMGTAAFVALLMALCDHRFTATQYALLSALASFGRVYVGPVAGYATDPKYWGLDWATFFFFAFISALPGLFLVWLLRKRIEAAENAAAAPA
jgi:MFS transporter, PAT family, beta-lactamase induction signal transducer AmpG